MKVFNVVVGFDLYIVAENADAAKKAALEIIQTGEKPGEFYHYEPNKLRDLPARQIMPFYTEPVVNPLTKRGVDLDKADVREVFEALNKM